MTTSAGPHHPAWRAWVLAIAAAATIATAAGLVLLTRRVPAVTPSETPPNEPFPTSDRLYLSGLDYSAYDGSDPVFRLQARELIHRKRKLGPFTINPVKEVELRSVRLEFFPRRPSNGTAGAGSTGAVPSLALILQGTMASKNLGFVSRVILRDLEIDDRRDGAASHLTAGEALWRPGEERLVVRGPYEIRDRSGTRSGRDAALFLQGTTWKTSVVSP